MLKRSFDVLMSALGLLALSPLFVVLPIWIKRDSPGPVFYRQERVGRHGVLFRIHKFRSMHVSTPRPTGPSIDVPGERGPVPERPRARPAGSTHDMQITPAGDPRITRSGRWLRATKLDEVPQLIDVFRGTMSLVGPRPEVPRYVALYPADLRDRVLSVRPGVTDPASLAYRDEGELLARAADPEREYVEVVMPAKLRLSTDYIARANFASDLRVILDTLAAVVRGRAP